MAEKTRKLYCVTDSIDEIFEYLDNYKPYSYDKYEVPEEE